MSKRFVPPSERCIDRCGFGDVVKRSDGRYQCAGCQKFMPPDWEARIKAQGLPLPRKASHD